MARSLGRSISAGSAFDFDVVSDAPPPPVRRPDPDPAQPEAAAHPAAREVERVEPSVRRRA